MSQLLEIARDNPCDRASKMPERRSRLAPLNVEKLTAVIA